MRIIGTTFLLLIFLSATLKAQLPKGDRILAWQVDVAENNNYDSAFAYAQYACMESIHLFFRWSDIEPQSGTFNTATLNILDIANFYFPAKGIKAELQIATINTLQKETPSDLMNTNFDNPTMIGRFKILLDTLFAHIPDLELTALNIGNESDIFMGTDSLQYSRYKTFLDSVVPYAKQLYYNLHGTSLKVGTTFTLEGLVNASKSSLCKMVNNGLDIVAVTYYPLNPDFTMKPPSVVSGDFGSLVNIYSDTLQPIYFVECGYASGNVCNSSETLQAQFFQNVFSAWDTYYNNIKYLTIFKSTDWSQQEVNNLATYYGISDTIFKEYLRTLGVRTWNGNGSNKPAYEKILCELQARNWCAVNCNTAKLPHKNNKSIPEIFPNPSQGHLRISFPENITKIELYNSTGKLKGTFKSKELNISGLPQGIYYLFIHLKTGEIERKKIVKI